MLSAQWSQLLSPSSGSAKKPSARRLTEKTSVAPMKHAAVAMKKLQVAAMKKKTMKTSGARNNPRKSSKATRSTKYARGERPRRARMLQEEKKQLEADVSRLNYKVEWLQAQVERQSVGQLETLAEKNFELITVKGDLEEVLRERSVVREEIAKLKRQNRDLEIAMAQSNFCLLGTPGEIRSRAYAAGYRSSVNFSVKFGNDMETHCQGWLHGRESAEVSKTRVKEEPMTD